MKNFFRYFFSCLLLLLISNTSNAQFYTWAKGFGDLNFDDIGYAICVDPSGNVLTTGTFKDTADLDPGPGVSTFVAAGLEDVFISKLDAAGNLIWAKQLAGVSKEYSYGITTDAQGNCYLTGGFYGKCDFDPGPGLFQLTPFGGEDVFVCKLSPAGNFIWAVQLGGANSDEAYAIKTRPNGDVLVAGHFSTVADFDPSAASFNLTSAGGTDAFICQLTAGGLFQSAFQIGGSGNDNCSAFALDNTGAIYSTGWYQATCDFDPSPATHLLTAVGGSIGRDAFVCKLNASGNFSWAKSMGGINAEYSNGIAVDANKNVITAGWYSGTADFDPNSGVQNLISYPGSSGNDVFISKLDSIGNYVWAKSIGGIGIEAAYGIACDASGAIYTVGWFQDTVDFDPTIATNQLISNGDFDVFVQKLDANGNFVWGANMGSYADDGGYAIALDASNNVYTTGQFSNTADFDPHPTHVFNLHTIAHLDVYVNKLSGCYQPYDTLLHFSSDTICANTTAQLTIGGSLNAATQWGIYNGACGGNLVSTATSNIASFTATQSGFYYVRAEGGCTGIGTCDSSYLVVLPSITPMLTIANNLDSICPVTAVFFQSTSSNAGTAPTYQWSINGTNFGTNSSTFTHANWANHDTVRCQLLSNEVCATASVLSNSIILTVNNVIASSTYIDNLTLIASPAGASYQWINCATHLPVNGATQATFGVTGVGTFGMYAVIVTVGNCSDTSDCLGIGEGIDQLFAVTKLVVSPNPGLTYFNVEAPILSTITIQNILGETIEKRVIYKKEDLAFNTENWKSGIYIINAVNASSKRVAKWEKY